VRVSFWPKRQEVILTFQTLHRDAREKTVRSFVKVRRSTWGTCLPVHLRVAVNPFPSSKKGKFLRCLPEFSGFLSFVDRGLWICIGGLTK
jgi:hypothetical protein